jgi:hypothetical protein
MKLFNRLAGFFAITTSLSCLNASGYPTWPAAARLSSESSSSSGGALSEDDAIVRSLPVCIAAKSWSAGELGTSVLYRYHREGKRLSVGYFVYWTTERPWGANALSYSVLPALFIDAFYSHLFFMFPGAQRFIHGPGDIEGARIVYEENEEGRWVPIAGAVDDAFHREVALSPSDFVDSAGRVRLTTDVWSHQLAASQMSQPRTAPEGRQACFGGSSIAPLTEAVADAFRLGSQADPRRAAPAWKLDRPTPAAPERVTAAPSAPRSPAVPTKVAVVER